LSAILQCSTQTSRSIGNYVPFRSATAKPADVNSTSAQQNNAKQNNLELQYWPPNKMATIAQLNAVRAENQRLIHLWIIDNSKISFIIYRNTRRYT
jgi:hypothetical protein